MKPAAARSKFMEESEAALRDGEDAPVAAPAALSPETSPSSADPRSHRSPGDAGGLAVSASSPLPRARVGAAEDTPASSLSGGRPAGSSAVPVPGTPVTKPWPSMVRGMLLKRCGIHGWQPRYARLRPSDKVFRYSRAKTDLTPRLELLLDHTVSVQVHDPVDLTWRDDGTRRRSFRFTLLTPLGRMHFAARSAESATQWVGALRFAVLAPATAGSVAPGVRAAPGVVTSPVGSAAEIMSTDSRDAASDGAADASDGRDVGADSAGGDAEDAEEEDEEVGAEAEVGDGPAESGAVPVDEVPEWMVAAAARHQRELIAHCSAEGKSRFWVPAAPAGDVECFSAKGSLPGARGDGLVRWPTGVILRELQEHRGDVDSQFNDQSELQQSSSHFIVSQLRYDAPSVFVGAREFVVMTHWRVYTGAEAEAADLPPGTLVVSASSHGVMERFEGHPVTRGHTRGVIHIGGWVVRPRGTDQRGLAQCDATYVSKLDPRGQLPHSIVQSVVSKQGALVRSLNQSLERRYGSPTWEAYAARRSEETPFLRNLGWRGPATATQTTPKRPPPRPSPPRESGRGTIVGGATKAVRRADAAAEDAPRGPTGPSGGKAAARAVAPLRLPADSDPSLSRPHAFRPLALLALLLPFLAWVLASALLRPASGPSVVAGVAVPPFAPAPESVAAPVRHALDALAAAVSAILPPAPPAPDAAAPTSPGITPVPGTVWVAGGSSSPVAGLRRTLLGVPGVALLMTRADPVLAAHVAVLACAVLALRVLYRGAVGPSWMSTRQKLSIASWTPPSEGNIHGSVVLDATAVIGWIARARAASGRHITVTHVVVKAVGLALRASPQINGRIVLGEYLPAGSVDVGCLVALEREEGGVRAGDLAYCKVKRADRVAVAGIADEVCSAAERLRSHRDANFEATNRPLRGLPTWAIRPLVHWLGWLSSGVGVPLPCLGVRAHPVGSCMVTSVGGMGLDTAFAPFTPFLHVPLLVTIGALRDDVIAVNGAPAVRKVLSVTATVDHRVVDGAGAATLARVLRAVFANPGAMLGSPDDAGAA